MKTRMKLKPFLGKRNTSLKEICERNNISSYKDLVNYLENVGVESPPEEKALQFLVDESIG